MAVVQTLIGNIKGPAGATGATGPQGPQGDAATIEVGSVSTTAYGNAAQVTNVGTENEAILNFVIPQGKPGERTTTIGSLTLDTITTSTDEFPSPAVGDTGATAFGKIVKFFADALSAIQAKLDAANVVNNLTTTEAGYALDARQGKALNDSLNTNFELVDGTFGEQSISPYQSASNAFTAPSDGYVLVNHNVTSSISQNVINVYVNNKLMITLRALGHTERQSIFVKQNSKIYHTQTNFTTDANYWIMFYPFVYKTK